MFYDLYYYIILNFVKSYALVYMTFYSSNCMNNMFICWPNTMEYCRDCYDGNVKYFLIHLIDLWKLNRLAPHQVTHIILYDFDHIFLGRSRIRYIDISFADIPLLLRYMYTTTITVISTWSILCRLLQATCWNLYST